MKIESLKLVCFSPTGTSKAVIQGIARGIDHGGAELVDVTTPDARQTPLETSENELLIVGVPVYMGRVPAVIIEWLRAIRARNTPAVAVVVYGNRVFDDALIELADLLAQGGCRPIAGAAYIGEHSFSSPGTPTAEGRPDARDLDHAESFGRQIGEKLAAVSSVDEIPEAPIPGSRPYRGDSTLWVVDFVAIGDECTQCGICADGCPAGAIDPEDSRVIDTGRCITCCACIKHCPENARTMKSGPVMDASVRLSTLYAERKGPELFI